MSNVLLNIINISMTPYSITYSLSEVKCVEMMIKFLSDHLKCVDSESTRFQMIRQKIDHHSVIYIHIIMHFLPSKGVQFVCTASILNSLIIDIQERSKTRNKPAL